MASDDAELEAYDPEHEFHFRYNRRLSCFSHSVSNLAFSNNGRYLLSGTESGDIKVWDTGCWAEAARLKGCKREELRALAISPAQRWLVAAYPSQLQVFECKPPWRLEQALPATLEPSTKALCEWSCIAFSPMVEVDHPSGHTGQDNHLAAFSTNHLCVIDYSGGWGPETPQRTRTLMQSGEPTCLAFTACGWWIICGFRSGQIQIWNAFSLTMEKTLSGHSDVVNCLTASPRTASYEARFVSCGVDQTLRVWHSCGWILEQHVHDTRCDRNGVLRCVFSATGRWLASVAMELSVWRVCLNSRKQISLRIHQRLAPICGAEGLRVAAFCNNSDAVAVGSRDGVLSLWTKCPGIPPREQVTPPSSPATQTAPGAGRSDSSFERALPRPMQRITPQGIVPLGRPGASAGAGAGAGAAPARGEWLRAAHLRTLAVAPLQSRSASVGCLVVAPTAAKFGAGAAEEQRLGGLHRQSTLHDFRSLHSQSPQSEVGSSMQSGSSTVAAGGSVRDVLQRASVSTGPLGPLAADAGKERLLAARKTIAYGCRPMQRVTLDPKVITEYR